jgi:hypothetical protein
MSFGVYEEAILKVLLTKTPSGPTIRPEEIFFDIWMNDLNFLDEYIQNHEPTFVKAFDESQSSLAPV